MNDCTCPEPTITLARQWTLDIPPSGITPKPMYICGECYGTKFNTNNTKTEIMNNQEQEVANVNVIKEGTIFQEIDSLKKLSYEIRNGAIGIERRSLQLSNNNKIDNVVPEIKGFDKDTVEEQLDSLSNVLKEIREVLSRAHDNFYESLGEIK